MGIAFGGRETFVFDSYGRVLNPQLRTYRPFTMESSLNISLNLLKPRM